MSNNVMFQVIDALSTCMTPEVAQQILQIEHSHNAQAREDELASLANAGTISEAQRSEYLKIAENYDLLSIVKLRAEKVIADSIS